MQIEACATFACLLPDDPSRWHVDEDGEIENIEDKAIEDSEPSCVGHSAISSPYLWLQK